MTPWSSDASAETAHAASTACVAAGSPAASPRGHAVAPSIVAAGFPIVNRVDRSSEWLGSSFAL
jgi:hypothetical protein